MKVDNSALGFHDGFHLIENLWVGIWLHALLQDVVMLLEKHHVVDESERFLGGLC